MSRYYVYILECSDGTYYTGQTNDLETRVEQHNSGRGGRYTRTRTPVKLKYHEECESRAEAMHREREVKKLSRDRKKELIETC